MERLIVGNEIVLLKWVLILLFLIFVIINELKIGYKSKFVFVVYMC